MLQTLFARPNSPWRTTNNHLFHGRWTIRDHLWTIICIHMLPLPIIVNHCLAAVDNHHQRRGLPSTTAANPHLGGNDPTARLKLVLNGGMSTNLPPWLRINHQLFVDKLGLVYEYRSPISSINGTMRDQARQQGTSMIVCFYVFLWLHGWRLQKTSRWSRCRVWNAEKSRASEQVMKQLARRPSPRISDPWKQALLQIMRNIPPLHDIIEI